MSKINNEKRLVQLQEQLAKERRVSDTLYAERRRLLAEIEYRKVLESDIAERLRQIAQDFDTARHRTSFWKL